MTGRNRSSTASRDPDALLARAGIQPDRDQDQHFLVDDRVLDRLPTYVEGVDTNHVLEIGAGTGALTDRLLNVADRVTAVERDARLAEFLREEFADARGEGRLEIAEGDALSVELPEFTASVSNLPYGVSSEVLFRLLPAKRPLVVTVQTEFAERMVADPGTAEYGRLSVTAGHYAECEIVETVPPEAFSPPPAVESAVVRTAPREPNYAVDETAFLAFVRGVFTQRRKTVRNAIRNTTHISGIERPGAVVEAADEALLSQRAGDLAPAEFAELARLGCEVGGVSSEGATSGEEAG
ncbi:16S ribosomal RNA methyltransferase A [Halococcus agarilyticus]|uniref:16S ribosomal RNA methyltransferase A n=1 Tax=Halococcus agarilyticus TaxID=1232219 RepID=UPI000677A91A|nr:16S ribosomal RNA methyltransferase A [Halococcus agarilyticus]